MAQLIDLLSRAVSPTGIVLTILLTILIFYLIDTFLLAVPNPTGMPLLHEPPGARRFRWRTRLAFHRTSQTYFRTAWDTYLKRGKAVVLPGVGFRNEIVLPPSQMRWALSQPLSTLGVGEAFADVDQVQWSLGDMKYVVDDWPGDVIKRQMNGVLEVVCASLNDELQRAFEERFGTDAEDWKELDLFETVRLVVAQAASRFVVGETLCRNEEYLKLSLAITDNLVFTAGLAGACPRVLRPLVGPLCRAVVWRQIQKLKPMWRPLYDARVAHCEKYAADDPDHAEPGDIIQMMFRWTQAERPAEFRDFESFTRRLCAMNFTVIHQTGIMMTNLILDILGSDAEFNTVAVLRDEVQRVLHADAASGNDGGEPAWTKAKLARLVRADSAGRETMRLHSFGGRATFRYVHQEDLETPEGHLLHKGNVVCFLGQAVQTDGDIFPEPFQYDPFRFSRIRENAELNGEGSGGKASFVTTSAEFLPWGHGPHACPGRFLIDFEFKMTIAYLLRNYDLEFPPEYNGKRPPNVWVTEAVFPPPGARIRVRRRKAAV